MSKTLSSIPWNLSSRGGETIIILEQGTFNYEYLKKERTWALTKFSKEGLFMWSKKRDSPLRGGRACGLRAGRKEPWAPSRQDSTHAPQRPRHTPRLLVGGESPEPRALEGAAAAGAGDCHAVLASSLACEHRWGPAAPGPGPSLRVPSASVTLNGTWHRRIKGQTASQATFTPQTPGLTWENL